MVKKMSVLLSVFGASGYRYKFSLYTFDKVWGVEGSLPACGGVFLFLHRSFYKKRATFSYKSLYCNATDNLSEVSVGTLAHKMDILRSANCVAVLLIDAEAERNSVARDIIRRNINMGSFRNKRVLN